MGRFDTEEFAARKRDLYVIRVLKDKYYKIQFEWTVDDVLIWEKKLEIYKLSDYHKYGKKIKGKNNSKNDCENNRKNDCKNNKDDEND